MTDKRKKTTQQPVQHVRSGYVTGSIWENKAGDGQVFYNVTFERSYKEGDDFKNTASFGTNDLAHLNLCSLKASIAIDVLSEKAKGGR